jgi:hypothetical protein
MSNKGNFDLSGVFHVQQNYLTDLSNSYPDVNNAPLIAKYVLDLQEKIKDVDTSYKNANSSADAVLTQQNNMIDIVSKEQTRLDEKKFLIDQAEMGEQRKVLLTESNQLRNAEYTKIILCVVAGLFIFVILRLIKSRFVEEPSTQNIDTLFIILHIINFIVWTIVIFYIYVKIQSRSQIDFNQLELPPPALSGLSTPAISDYNNLFSDLGVCVQKSCCGPETEWEPTTKECVPIEPFTELNTYPQFNTRAVLQPIDKPKPYDRNTATYDEIRQQAVDTFNQANEKILGKNNSKLTDIADKLNDPAELASMGIDTTGTRVQDMLSNLDLPDSAVDTEPKCDSFTTIDHAYGRPTRTNAMSIVPYTQTDKSDLGFSTYP